MIVDLAKIYCPVRTDRKSIRIIDLRIGIARSAIARNGSDAPGLGRHQQARQGETEMLTGHGGVSLTLHQQ